MAEKAGPVEFLEAEPLNLRDALIYPAYLNIQQQQALVDACRAIAGRAPLRHPIAPWGKPMSVQMTSAGRVGWITDRRGYRYEPRQPDGSDWPKIPQIVTEIWAQITGSDRIPDCCLVNYYAQGARMGLHQDRDEGDFSWPVVSISLGDAALFRIGSTSRRGATESVWLSSGDIVVLSGRSRLAYHGVDRIRAGSSSLLENGGRINLTLRVVQQDE